MDNIRWQRTRIGLMAFLITGVIAILIRSFFVLPNKGDQESAKVFEFPATVPLEGWKQIEVKSLKPKRGDEKEIDSQVYIYDNKTRKIEIVANYREHDGGDVRRLLFRLGSIPRGSLDIETKYQNEMGYYFLFEYGNKVHLSTCINRVGENSVSNEQFVKNKYKYGWSPQQAALWLLGEKDFFETGCLWTLVSIPTSDSNDLEKNYQTLETVFGEWYSWWKQKL
ncbi:cyanoexosortase A system-associated protein [Aphanothece sacrum]|uniref:Cyanosortase-associated family protein n=1 Tax=Aphanothece sacrum FPU1 TaxID=1920663 RepID=A0A401IJ88_APHSA|nr:cyanoexosortase A system-associated protein [Aphanothece sacrum]GBF81372.1 cyanosortase-associated family protein [Aphanothece sacrum FPU1]GBF85437.1 cyanosortase-associated family protein [Aphanothece sacrum FPU3]